MEPNQSMNPDDHLEGGREVEGDRKKRKIGSKKSFKPQPVIPIPSTSTFPEDSMDLPPPPVERKIARRRDSTRAIRERAESISPPTKKRQRSREDGPSGIGSSRTANESPVGSGPHSNPSEIKGNRQTITNLETDFEDVDRGQTSSLLPQARPQQDPTMAPPSLPSRKTRKSLAAVTMDSVVPVAICETPLSRKNQEMRQEASRRVSMGSRGQRASSSFGKGELAPLHPSILSKNFYKHISPTLPEPLRCRHLLIHCSKRVSDTSTADEEPKKGKSRAKRSRVNPEHTPEGAAMTTSIMDDFLARLIAGQVQSNTFAESGDKASAVNMQRHPLNVINEAEIAKGLPLNRKYAIESKSWQARRNEARSRQTSVFRAVTDKKKLNADPDAGSEDWQRAALDLASSVIQKGEIISKPVDRFHTVEFQIDTLLQTSHVATQYSLLVSRFLDGVFSSLNSDLRLREQLGSLGIEIDDVDTLSVLASSRSVSTSRSGNPTRPDTMDLLRSLASAEASHQNQETVAAAATVAPVSRITNTGSMTPRRPAAAMTPRRIGAGMGTTPGRGIAKDAASGLSD